MVCYGNRDCGRELEAEPEHQSCQGIRAGGKPTTRVLHQICTPCHVRVVFTAELTQHMW